MSRPVAWPCCQKGKVVYYPADRKQAALAAGAVRLDLDPTPFGLGDGVLAIAPASGMDAASPWWYVNTTKLATEANVEIVIYRVVLMGAADPLNLQADPVAPLVPNSRLARTAADGPRSR